MLRMSCCWGCSGREVTSSSFGSGSRQSRQVVLGGRRRRRRCGFVSGRM